MQEHMKILDKVAFGFFGGVVIVSGVCVVLAAMEGSEASRGISGSLNLPAWTVPAAPFVASLVILIIMLVNRARVRKGRKPF